MESDSSAILSDTSVGKLKELLKLESRSHRDTGQCYDTLQKEYDDLLRKYAQAENTIDKLRIDSLRERIEKSKAEQDDTKITECNSNVWKCLYDDLICRTNKLQNAVTEFQAHLANHEFTGEELNEIFDRLHNDFENIANAFQSMQALGNKEVCANEKYPEESVLADDLEGNLYRLGLRLEEIQDDIGDQLRSTFKESGRMQTEQNQMPTIGNNSESPKMMHNIDSKKSYEGECSETETTKGENNIESDDDDNLQLGDWKPATEDLTELTFYKKQIGNQFLGIDPKYLSRSFSAPDDLANLQRNGNTTLMPNGHLQDLPREQVELNNSHRSTKNASSSIEDSSANKRRKSSSTVAVETLNLTKSPPPLSKEESANASSHPNALTSTEDSGYLEGSHPSQQGFPSRYPSSPLRNHSRINEGETTSFELTRSQDPIMEESAGEQYRQRLDSLRSYILAKRAANNSSSLSALENTDKRPRNFVRGKKNSNLNYRNSPRISPRLSKLNTVAKLNASYNVNDPGSSTTESVFSSIAQPADEEAMTNRKLVKEEKPAIQKKDIETLRDEMRGVRDIVLDLKDSLTSPNRSPSKIPVPKRVNESQKARSVDNLRKDEIDASRVRNTKPTDTRISQVHQLQNKQFEMLEKLDNKLDDISKKMRNNTLNQRQSLSRDSARDNTDRLSSPYQIHTKRTPHGSHDSSYNHIDEDQNVNIHEVGQTASNVEVCEIVDEYNDAFTETRFNPHQTHADRGVEELRDSSFNSAEGEKHINNAHLNQRYCTCDNCQTARDSCVIARDNGNGCRNMKCRNAQVCSNRPSSDINTSLYNHRGGGGTSFSHQVGEENINSTSLIDEEVKNTPISRGQRKHLDSSDSVKSYRDKFDEIGQQINELSSHMKECKENEEKRLREETLKKQKMLVKTLEEKLEGLSTKIEENEKKVNYDPNSVNVSPGPMYVVPCPICGRIGAHRHDAYIFNGHSIIEPVNGSPVRNLLNSVRPNAELRQGNTTINPMNSVRPSTGLRQNDTFWMHSTPKNDYYQHFNGETPEKRSPSPNVYHHYHTVYSPQDEEPSSRQPKGTGAEYYNADAGTRDLIIVDRMQDSLEKASLAALHMENLSKKMLRGIAMDLFNSGPSEF